MHLSEDDVRNFLIEIFLKFKLDYRFIEPRPFLESLCKYYGSQIPETESSRIKYNLCLDVLHHMYAKKKDS
jgi:hypothetical protein